MAWWTWYSVSIILYRLVFLSGSIFLCLYLPIFDKRENDGSSGNQSRIVSTRPFSRALDIVRSESYALFIAEYPIIWCLSRPQNKSHLIPCHVLTYHKMFVKKDFLLVNWIALHASSVFVMRLAPLTYQTTIYFFKDSITTFTTVFHWISLKYYTMTTYLKNGDSLSL